MTEVVNKKDRLYDVYIGRGSIWGNPFTHLTTSRAAETLVSSRDESIERYEVYIRERLNHEPGLVKELMALEGKVLGCFCKPKSCHGDILVKLIEELKPPR